MLQAVICDERDNVATAVADLKAHQDVLTRKGASTVTLQPEVDIALGHKFALCDIEAGGSIIKYGYKIGVATEAIKKGHHVHVHNVDSLRGRGDR